MSEAHGKGAALQVGYPWIFLLLAKCIFRQLLKRLLQLNRFLEEGSVQLLPTDQSYQVISSVFTDLLAL